MSNSIDTLISNARNYAESAISGALHFINMILELDTLTTDQMKYITGVPLWSYTQIGTDATSKAKEVTRDAPERPIDLDIFTPDPAPIYTQPNLSRLSTLIDRIYNIINAHRDFTENPPQYTAPGSPGAFTNTPPSKPDIDYPNIPPEPHLPPDPTIPVLAGIVIPPPPTLDLDQFKGVRPVDTTIVPGNTFAWNEIEVSFALLTDIQNKLASDIVTGSYGMGSDDEEAVWVRARERATVDSQFTIDELKRQFAVMNHSLPPGAMIKAMSGSLLKYQWNLNDINREITSKKVDLYAKHREITLSEGAKVVEILLTYHTAFMERALNAEKAIVQIAIDIYNATVAKFKTQLDIYATDATVYKTLIEGELGKCQLYKAQVEGQMAIAELNKAHVELYAVQVNSTAALVNIYKVSMEAAQVKATIEASKAELFKAQVEAFVAQIKLKEAEYELYKAKVAGEQFKVDGYRAKVDAYAASCKVLDAKVATLEPAAKVEIAKAEYELKELEHQMDIWKADYSADVQAKGFQAQVYHADIAGWAAKWGALEKAYSVLQQSNSDQLSADRIAMSESIERAKAQLMAYRDITDLKLGTGQLMGNIYANKVAAALNSLNTLVQKAEIEETGGI